jgi:hypothetical protein
VSNPFSSVRLTESFNTCSVDLKIASIATYLPSTENQEGAFSGTTQSQIAPHGLTPMQEAALRAQQNEQQEKDADTRNLVWGAETDAFDLDADAEGEDDPDYVKQPDGSFLKVSDSHEPVLIGVRNEAGVIETIPAAKQNEEAVYGGEAEEVPMHLSDLVRTSSVNLAKELLNVRRMIKLRGQ